jgi:carbonic anhydrase
VEHCFEFHIHQPSEHTINAKQYPLELHIDALAPDGSLYTVSTLAQVSNRTSLIFQNILKNKAFAVPRLTSYWAYPSTYVDNARTPPSTLPVNLNVSTHVKEITAKDLATLMSKSLPPRAIQSRDGRVITLAHSPATVDEEAKQTA